jgi:AAHS family 4-hydroxybenzoate transporter-like MFS transporter
MLWVVFFSSLIAIYFFNNWIPTLLNGSGLSGTKVVIISTGLQFGGIIGTLIAAPIVVRLPGFVTAGVGYFCAALAMLVLGSGGGSFWFLAVAVLMVGLFLIGTQSVLNASCAAVYPPTMRSTGVGWGFGVGRIGSVLSPGIAGALVAMQWKPSELFLIAAVPTVAASVSVLVVHWLVRRRDREEAGTLAIAGGISASD